MPQIDGSHIRLHHVHALSTLRGNLQQHTIVDGALIDEELGVSCANSEFVVGIRHLNLLVGSHGHFDDLLRFW
jgi:hypothetical protein